MFSRVATDEYYEFGRKFDIGIDLLDGIKTDTGDMKDTLGEINGTLGDVKGTLGDMKGTLGDVKSTLGDMKGSLTNMNTTLETFVLKQDGHNQRLEKILEKLAER